MFVFELLCDYNSELVGIAILEDDKYNLHLINHPEKNTDQAQLDKVLNKIVLGPSITHDLKLTSFFLKKVYGLYVNNCVDVISALSVFGKVVRNTIPGSPKIDVILKTSLYNGGLDLVPKSVLEKEYKKRLLYIKRSMSYTLNSIKGISLLEQYNNHFAKISNAVGCLEASGFSVDTTLRDELISSPEFVHHHQKLRELKSVTHPVYSIGGSSTGRLAPGSMYGAKLNSLAIPKGKMRECIIPKNDLLVEIDYTSFEIYVLLYLYAPENIKDLFTKDENIYDILSKETGIQDRDIIKRIVFQKIYGQERQMGDFQVKKLLSSVGASEKCVYTFKTYFDWIDEVKDYIYYMIRKNNNTIVNIFGRHITFEESSRDRKNLYFNNMIQMTAADIAFKTLIGIHDYLKNFSSNLILFCHDSYVIDLRKTEFCEVKNILELAQNVIPGAQFPVKVYAGKNYNNMRQLINE